MRLLFTAFILSLTACTITKRHFGPGYHVEWKKPVSKSGNETDQINVIDSRKEPSTISEEDKEVFEELNPADSVHTDELISLDNSTISIEEQAGTGISETQSEFKNDLMIKSDQISNDEDVIDEPKRKVEPFTWVALAGIIIGFLLVLISFLASSPEMVLSIALFIGIGVVVFSIISVVRIHRNPERYKGKGLSWTLFGLSMVGIGAVLFAIVYAIFLLTGGVGFL